MRGTLPTILILLISSAGCTDSQNAGQEDSETSAQTVEPVKLSARKPAPDEPQPTPPPANATGNEPEDPDNQAQEPDNARQESESQPPVPEPVAENPEAMRSIDEMLLFFPIKFPNGDWEPDGLHYEDVWFQANDGTKLHGWYCPVEEPRAVVLFAHGNAGNLSHRAWLAKYMQERLRVSVMMFDYRGYGRSAGTPTAKGILQDGRAACTALAGKAGVDESELVLMGRSLGGAVVVPLAVEISARGLILQSTFSSMKEVAAFHYPKLSWLVAADKLNSASHIPKYAGRLLQSHGNVDGTVPYESGRKLFEAANEPKQWVTIPGGDHNDAQTPEYYETLDAFIEGLPEE